ncbi:MAG: competence/damage-inducible protein A [Nitrospirae bacterium]|nr:competence/damage-inducible protein A [Nitrospirota bacterium]
MEKTAGIIIIGNEILSGKVRDINSPYLTDELRALGVNVLRISIIPDDIDEIGREVSEFSKKFDYAFTAGGVGPTHDDVTMAGIAKGFGLRIMRHPRLEEILRSRYGDSINDTILKMAEVPEGADIIVNKDLWLPAVYFKNIYIFPGIPKYLKMRFDAVKERFRCNPFLLRKVFIKAHETDIAPALYRVVETNPNVMVGSYPIIDNSQYKVMVTLESKREDSLNRAFSYLIEQLPEEIVIRAE